MRVTRWKDGERRWLWATSAVNIPGASGIVRGYVDIGKPYLTLIPSRVVLPTRSPRLVPALPMLALLPVALAVVVLASLAVSMRVRPHVTMPGVEVVHLSCPDLGVRMNDFSRTAEHVALGYRAALAALDRPLVAA